MTEGNPCFMRLSKEWWDTLQKPIKYLIPNKWLNVIYASCVLVRNDGTHYNSQYNT